MAVIPILDKRKIIVLAKLQTAPLRTLAASDRVSFGRVGRDRDATAVALGGPVIAENRKVSMPAADFAINLQAMRDWRIYVRVGKF